MAAKRRSEEEEVREMEIKRERNRVAFEAWLERKKDEQKKIAAEERRAAQLKLEIAEQKRGVGEAAFRNWLRRKQAEDEMMKKDKTVQRELHRLREQERNERRKRAEESFKTWKLQKDLDISLQRSNKRHRARSLSPQSREPTPSVPGYCSVWSCDLDLASYILDHVPRGDHALTDVTPFSEQNFTICHDPT